MNTLNDVFDRYEREVVPTLAPRTQKDYARHIRKLRERFGAIHPDAVKPKDVGLFLDRPKGRICANREVAVLSAAYSYAVGAWFVADRNPCSKVRRHPTKARTRYISDSEFMIVYSRMPERIQVAMDIALRTSQREGDVLDLEWRHVSPEGIFFEQGKTGKRLLVAMSESLRRILERARRLSPPPCTHVISTSFGKPYTHEGFRALWQRMRRQIMAEGVIQDFPHFHDLRAKAVSDSDSIEEASARAGHQNTTITRAVYDRNVRVVQPLL